ncbi:MAG: glycosyltransferase family 2 protein, partial [Patescibacteria group bacterium]
VVDSGNTDGTNAIAKKYKAKIISASPGSGYANFRNVGLKAAKGDWVFYLDADERATPELVSEIPTLAPGVYQIPRKNIYLGRQMHYGGWGGDHVIRLFYKDYFQGYKGDLHEQPIFNSPLLTTHNALTHYSHRDLKSMLEKTIVFTDYEARLRLKANHPPIVWWRLIRVMFSEFWLRFVRLSAGRDGTPGVIDGLFQVFNMFIIYARLWELQNEAGTNT